MFTRCGITCYCKWLMSTGSTMNIDEQNICHSNSFEINVALLDYSAFYYTDKTSSGESFLHLLVTMVK